MSTEKEKTLQEYSTFEKVNKITLSNVGLASSLVHTLCSHGHMHGWHGKIDAEYMNHETQEWTEIFRKCDKSVPYASLATTCRNLQGCGWTITEIVYFAKKCGYFPVPKKLDNTWYWAIRVEDKDWIGLIPCSEEQVSILDIGFIFGDDDKDFK
jgi:hypothetical protein